VPTSHYDSRLMITMPFFLFFLALCLLHAFSALRITGDQRVDRARCSTDLITQGRIFLNSHHGQCGLCCGPSSIWSRTHVLIRETSSLCTVRRCLCVNSHHEHCRLRRGCSSVCECVCSYVCKDHNQQDVSHNIQITTTHTHTPKQFTETMVIVVTVVNAEACVGRMS
jgi:hypothetical protein